MTTDQFDGITPPQDISQSSYVELIYAKTKTGQAIKPASQTVENSLNQLAFPKAAQTPSAAPAVSQNRYRIATTPNNVTSQSLRSQRVATEFSRLLRNPISAVQELLSKQTGPVLAAPFDTIYEIVSLGVPEGLPTPYAGLVFLDESTILIGGSGNSPSAFLYSLPVTRGVDGHITGVGAVTPVIAAPNVDGGVAYHPTGVLFVCGWPANTLHQYLPGDTSPRVTTDLTDFGVNYSVGSIGFIPTGYPGAGSIKLITWPTGSVYNLLLTANLDGTFTVNSATLETSIGGGPEGFVYVPLGSDLFDNPSAMVTEFSVGQVSTYELNSSGVINSGSRRLVLSGLSNAEGAAIDPSTGDYVFSTFGSNTLLYLIRGKGDGGFNPPDPPPDPPQPCNRVTNGTFDSNIAGWTNAGGTNPMITWVDSGRANCLTNSSFEQTITGLTPGRLVRVSFDLYSGAITPPGGMPAGATPSVPPPAPPDATWIVRSSVISNTSLVAPSGLLVPFVDTVVEQNSQYSLTFDTIIGVPDDGIVILRFYNVGYRIPYIDSSGVGGFQLYHSPVQFDNIELCEIDNVIACNLGISEVRTLIKFNGIPRKPVNVFSILARCVFRDQLDPFNLTTIDMLATADGRLGTVTPTSCAGADTCDFWKQQGPGGVPSSLITPTGINLLTSSSIVAGQTASVSSRTNWLWSIPGSTTGVQADSLVSLWPDTADGILESIEFLVLTHVVNDVTISPSGIGGPTVETCIGPFNCSPDPAQSFDFIIRYRNSSGLSKEFSQTITLDSLLQVDVVYPAAPNAWDTISALGNGLKGTTAEWESIKFVLDAVNGTGLDQCTEPLTFTATGTGNLVLSLFSLEGSGSAVLCNAEIIITEVNKGVSTNEIQHIILPSPSSGEWTLTFNCDGQTATITIPWDASADQIETSMESMVNIGSGNVTVTGSGTAISPFIVTFGGTLAARDLRPLVADGTDLVGASTAFCVKTAIGTANERQTIIKDTGIDTSFVLGFNGAQSQAIAYNASLNTVKAALEAISTIGADNVEVTGTISDANAAYQGPWYIDFIGDLAGQNVSTLTTASDGYTVAVNWHGGIGVNDTQKVTVGASGGTFTLTLTIPEEDPVIVTTGNIDFNATAVALKSALIAVAGGAYESADLEVTKLDTQGNLNEWTIQFKGQWAHTLIPLIVVNGANLSGTSAILVIEDTKGAGTNERQQLDILRAQGGFYRLLVKIDNTLSQTVPIPWNTDEDGIQLAILALPLFEPGDVSVRATEIRKPDVVASYLITFNKRFGDVPLIRVNNKLQCVPFVSDAASPPYSYPIGECSDEDNAFCSPGPLLCRPGDGDEPSEIAICAINDSANVFSELVLQRDLFAPKAGLTVRDMAIAKGLRPSQYNAYLRDFKTNTLRQIGIDTVVNTKMSIVLIESDDDTSTSRARLSQKLRHGPEILPARMIW